MKPGYNEICLTLWGCIPIDVQWAKNTNLYKEYIACHSK